MSTEFKLALALLFGVVLGILIEGELVHPFTTSAERQGVNLRVAKECLPTVEALLRSEVRFKEVKAIVYTGQDGAIGLRGRVRKDEDLCKLMKAIADEKLPVAISWEVEVSPGG